MDIMSEYVSTEELYKSLNSLVYRGYCKKDNQRVILKTLNQDYPSPEKIARFKLEYEITRRLNTSIPTTEGASGGVVAAYDLGINQQRWVMVLEDFGGESLDRLVKSKQFTLADILRVAIQIVDILEQMHQQHVIHKDINPSNIVLNPATNQLKLIDFGISTTLMQESMNLRNPNMLEGTLAYMSPEQTGRMNRTVDYRTDFYSLGVTLYELLTGQLPFQTSDVLALVHSHIAKPPTPLHQLNPDIPRPLSDIVLKLMAKNAEDRYQSTFSLKTDLQLCLDQWQAEGRVDPFPLHQRDVSSQFQIRQKLYGREREIDLLLAAFERVSQGTSEIMMVSGYTGIGKSALVREVYKPITRQRGYFISGKFDQFQRNIPYASLLQAFKLLVHQLLTESEIAAWREKLLAALEPNGQVIIEVIPEVELIIGPQPEVPVLPPTEARNRFNLVFQNFIKVFTRPEHPLVIFLDDLQWADGASLELIEVVMTARDSEYLFLIGAYRDNEVGEAHPLQLMLGQIQQAGTTVNHISLSPLTLPYVVQLLADTLYCTPEQAQPLAELVLAKTEGNPFFVNEFLRSLYAEELLTFDFEHGRWQWDLPQIQAQDISDNVAELMSDRVQKLEEETQRVLKLAACIGNQFDLQTLSIVSERSPHQTATDLWQAITEGLILPLDDAYKLVNLDVEGLADAVTVGYKFAHDQIQQAAYLLIPEAEKQTMHQRVGQLLLQNTSPKEREQKIFDIVNHLNLGRALVKKQSERDELAQLNLAASRKAKASAAYQPAFNYIQTGLELLNPYHAGADQAEEDSWERHYELALALHLEATETAYLNTDFVQMDRWGQVVLQRAKTLLDKVTVYEVQIEAFTAQNKLPEAVQTGLSILEQMGIKFPKQPNKLHILLGLGRTKLTLLGKRVETLSDLPEMSEPIILAANRIFRRMIGVVFLATPELFPLIVFRQVTLSVKYGNTAESAFGYSVYAIILSGVLGDIQSGHQFAQLSVAVMERFNATELKARIFFTVYFFIRPWKEHLRGTLTPLLEGYQSALETGDLVYATSNLNVHATGSFFIGKELAGLERELASYSEVISELKQERALHLNDLYQQAVLNLIERSENPHYLKGSCYDEEQMLPLHLEANDMNVLCNHYLIKIILCYLFGEHPQATENATNLEKYLEGVMGMYTLAIFLFYDSLAWLAVFPESPRSKQKRILKKVAINQKKLQKWAKHAPMNFLHKYYLVEAERANLLGNDQEARDYYDRAIKLAHEHEYLNEESLAYELAARFYLEREQTRIAGYYLRDAHYAYQRWGAVAKVKDLEEKYPQLLAQAGTTLVQAATSTTSTTGTKASSALDLASVLKASQAISGEIELDKLLTKLMGIVIENAGAQRGYLVLKQNGHWIIEAEGTIEAVKTDGPPAVTALQAIPIETDNDQLSSAIVNYVARTREDVVLNDAAQEGLFTQDPYVIQQQPKSILCMPLINQGKLTGILYLENNLTTGAFTSDRLEVLNLLSAQAAISIENASLYSHQVALTTGYSRFVPPEFLRFLNRESIVDINLGDHVQQEMAVLFSDIRSFTTLSETMTPQENFDFVNAYFGRVSPIIRQHNGVIVKYLGDGMMAVFPQRVEDALNASIEKVKQVYLFNQDRHLQGEPPIKIGVGIHTGKMMLGTVGEAERMQSDFLSDAVNLTARLEGLTKLYGASIVISQEALNRIKDPTQYQLRFLDRVRVKGRLEAVAVFEIFGGEPEAIIRLKMQTKTKFEEGLTLYYGQKFTAAGELFKEVLRRNPDDQAARLYLERSGHYLVHGAPADWAGVRVLHEK